MVLVMVLVRPISKITFCLFTWKKSVFLIFYDISLHNVHAGLSNRLIFASLFFLFDRTLSIVNTV